jgi:hypothetical protein
MEGRYELNCYVDERVRSELVERDGLTPVRYWPVTDRERYLRSRVPPDG